MRFNASLAKDALRILAETRLPNGKWNQFVCSDWVRPGPASQPPVAFWAVREIYRVDPDRDWLEEMYAPLCHWEEWWRTARDSNGNGLSEYVEPLGSGWDNSPRWDGGGFPIEPVDLNSLLLVGRRVLAWMARELGKPEADAVEWEKKADSTAQAIMEDLYSAEENRFYDRLAASGELRRILTPASFYPIWAGVPLGEKEIRSMIEETLLDPSVMGGELPFPTVARDEPTHEEDGFWRGPIWINQALVLLGVLTKYGYEDEAARARDRLLRLNETNDFIFELYNAETGRGRGCPEYGWSAALFMEIVLGELHVP
jgi:putative isomerase